MDQESRNIDVGVEFIISPDLSDIGLNVDLKTSSNKTSMPADNERSKIRDKSIGHAFTAEKRPFQSAFLLG